MKKPEMIIFDCGHTLLGGFDLNPLRGWEALFKYVKRNKDNLTAKQANDFSKDIFEQIETVQSAGFELHEWQTQCFLNEYLGLEFTISLEEIERVFLDNTYPCILMPEVYNMIDYINERNIRSGVISNTNFSGIALTEMIQRLLPNNKFEFIIASSEYIFRKPNSLIFALALKKANLSAENVWFCGDSVKADIEGSSAVGMLPVWYEDRTIENPLYEQDKNLIPNCKHLHIFGWNELIELLDKL